MARLVEKAEPTYGLLLLRSISERGGSPSSISREVRRKHLFRLHRGVYSVVPPSLLRVEGRWLGAVWAVGDDAALSWFHALALWDLRAAGSGPIHVTVPTGAGRRRPAGVILHRCRTLGTADVIVRRRIPVTTVSRTIADVRRALPPHQLKSVLRKAAKRHHDTGPQPEDLGPVEWSELERRFHAVCRRHSLPLPRAQQVIGPYTVDFLWPGARLIVEVDGWGTHGSQVAFEEDRARDVWLTAQGYGVLRFTWHQVVHRGPWVAKTVRAVLDRRWVTDAGRPPLGDRR
jgi:very-short-patch-repair endonuclease